MPHYSDGTEAKIGDQVYGKMYNTLGVRAGTIISITPGSESCNAMVGFLDVVPIGKVSPKMAVVDEARDAIRLRAILGEKHGGSGETFHLVECADYCSTNELTKLG